MTSSYFKPTFYFWNQLDYISAKLSVRMTNGPDIAATNFTFFDCRTYTTCTECVSSSYPCDWCVDGHRCTHDTAENCRNDILVTGVNVSCLSVFQLLWTLFIASLNVNRGSGRASALVPNSVLGSKRRPTCRQRSSSRTALRRASKSKWRISPSLSCRRILPVSSTSMDEWRTSGPSSSATSFTATKWILRIRRGYPTSRPSSLSSGADPNL